MSPYSPHFAGNSPQLLMTPLSPASPHHLGVEGDNMLSPMPYTTPQQLALGYGEEAKPIIPNFGYQQFDPSSILLFRTEDEVVPTTPSMGTEASFMTDDCVPELLSRDMSRETTTF